MALINILQMISADDGIDLEDANQKSLLIQRVNEAAKELYEEQDFREALDEKMFNIDVNSQVVALPWYVEHMRGWRYFNNRMPGILEDKANRYGDGKGNETWYQKWRHIKHSPIQREISNESTLKFSIPEPESEDIVFNIVG